jgi:hypothetical protein
MSFCSTDYPSDARLRGARVVNSTTVSRISGSPCAHRVEPKAPSCFLPNIRSPGPIVGGAHWPALAALSCEPFRKI